jgi:hypothetical protein
MPIRINLLAEEQAVEEMRRRDPIKRAIIGGAIAILLVIGWIGITQMTVSAARSELSDTVARLKEVDDSSRQVKSNQLAVAEYDLKIRALERYSTNRLFWASLLESLQRAALQDIRLMEVKADQKYGTGDIGKLFTTNIVVNYSAPPAKWKFWARSNEEAPMMNLVSNALATVTNKAPFLTNTMPYTTKITFISTNASLGHATAKVEFSTPPWAAERTVIEVRGRDYGNPPGSAIDELARRMRETPFFIETLEPKEGFRFTERPPQARPDPQDPQNPSALFVPFTIELTLKEKVLTGE